MGKGVTPAVATVLLVTVTIAAAGTIYTLVNDNIDQAKSSQTDIDLNMDGISKESCYREDSNTTIVLRNGATESVNASELSVLVEGRLKPDAEFNIDSEIVEPQSTFEVEIDSFIGSDTSFMMTDGDQNIQPHCFNLGDTNMYETSFESSGSEWEPFTTNKTITTSTTSATDEASLEEEALKAGRENGVGGHNHPPGGHGGMARTFNTDYDVLELDFKARADEWGRTTIMIKNVSEPGYETLWIDNSQCDPGDRCGYDKDWQTKTFDISKYPAGFMLIIGNNDDSFYAGEAIHDNEDHGWTIWADDVELAQLE